MIEVVKLTYPNRTTRNYVHWEVGKTNKVEWGGEMCRPGCLHGYQSLELAVLAKDIHCPGHELALICTTPEIIADDGLKIGMAEMTGVRWVELPKVTNEQRVEWAIKCSFLLPQPGAYMKWATAWLDGTSHSKFKARQMGMDWIFHNMIGHRAARFVEEIASQLGSKKGLINRIAIDVLNKEDFKYDPSNQVDGA